MGGGWVMPLRFCRRISQGLMWRRHASGCGSRSSRLVWGAVATSLCGSSRSHGRANNNHERCGVVGRRSNCESRITKISWRWQTTCQGPWTCGGVKEWQLHSHGRRVPLVKARQCLRQATPKTQQSNLKWQTLNRRRGDDWSWWSARNTPYSLGPPGRDKRGKRDFVVKANSVLKIWTSDRRTCGGCRNIWAPENLDKMGTFGTTTDQKGQKFATAADVDAKLGVRQKGKAGDSWNQGKICWPEVCGERRTWRRSFCWHPRTHGCSTLADHPLHNSAWLRDTWSSGFQIGDSSN